MKFARRIIETFKSEAEGLPFFNAHPAPFLHEGENAVCLRRIKGEWTLYATTPRPPKGAGVRHVRA